MRSPKTKAHLVANQGGLLNCTVFCSSRFFRESPVLTPNRNLCCIRPRGMNPSRSRLGELCRTFKVLSTSSANARQNCWVCVDIRAIVFSIVFTTRHDLGSTADIHFYDLLQFRVDMRLIRSSLRNATLVASRIPYLHLQTSWVLACTIAVFNG